MAEDNLQQARQQARAQLRELVEAARKGMIIPVRLPAQLEAIADLLDAAEQQSAAPQGSSAGSPTDDNFMQETAAFISHAVHELRTPMTSIRGYSDMLNTPGMGELNDMQRQFLDTIRTNARRMESLLLDVSDINKLRAGTMRVNPKMDMFKNIAMMVEKQMRPLAEQLNRQLQLDIPQGLPLLQTDGELLAKALCKMVENSLRYSAEGSGLVTLSARGENSVLVMTISDNGIGMTPAEISRLGELYFRSDHDVVRNYKGSGLGIPIAFGLIEVLGGRITVDSTPDVGTTFTIELAGMV